jgi:hypothetical protein
MKDAAEPGAIQSPILKYANFEKLEAAGQSTFDEHRAK